MGSMTTTTGDERTIAAKRAGVSDAVVARALAAYEEMPAGTGREERMRVAIGAIVKAKDAKLDTGAGDDGPGHRVA